MMVRRNHEDDGRRGMGTSEKKRLNWPGPRYPHAIGWLPEEGEAQEAHNRLKPKPRRKTSGLDPTGNRLPQASCVTTWGSCPAIDWLNA